MRCQHHLSLLRTLALVLTLTAFPGPGPEAKAAAGSDAASSDPASRQLPAHPRLLLNADGVAELKQRIATQPWARQSWDELAKAAEKSLSSPIELPPRGGNWSHNYVCPTHGARLSRGRQLGPWQWEHICPVGPHTLQGDAAKATLDFDGNTIAEAHARLAQQIVNHGLVFQVTGDARHARQAREILLAYVKRYRSYPLHDNQGKTGHGGRVASQSLTEADWLITFTQGADLVWATLSEADRTAVAEQVLRPALQEVILPRRLGIHNIQCHHNSAIGLVGFLLGDNQLITRAIDDPANGYHQQMRQGVLSDGMWLEGSSGYHFFTIAGLWPLTEAARNCGINLYGHPLQTMWDAPLSLAMPDFVLPNFNDSSTVPLVKQAEFYELAWARFQNPAYAPLLAQSDRRSRLAMLYGATNLPPAGQMEKSGSRNSPASGYAILQKGQGPAATWLCIKYGPHGGGHGHPDKNNFILYARGQVVAPDAGTHAYGSPLHHAWDQTTLAHNTLTANEESQTPATGKFIAFGTERDVDYATIEAGPIYSGVKFVRTVAMLNTNLVVFVDQIASDHSQTFDLVYHQMGTWEDLPTGETWTPPAKAGYKCFTGTTRRAVSLAGLTLQAKIAKDWPATLTIAGGEPTDIITGYGLLKTTADLVPMVMQRRQTQNTAFLWAISLDSSPVSLTGEPVADAAGTLLPQAEAVLVKINTSGEHWELLVNPQQKNVATRNSAGTAGHTTKVLSLP